MVPANAKFEHGGAYSLSALADQALLHGTPIGGGGGTPLSAPPIRKGVKLVFVPAPNLELAEFLRAQRANDMDGWQAYLSKYPSSQHTTEAKRSLAALFSDAGEASLQAYDKSVAAALPIYSELKTAKAKADKAHTPGAGSGLRSRNSTRRFAAGLRPSSSWDAANWMPTARHWPRARPAMFTCRMPRNSATPGRGSIRSSPGPGFDRRRFEGQQRL